MFFYQEKQGGRSIQINIRVDGIDEKRIKKIVEERKLFRNPTKLAERALQYYLDYLETAETIYSDEDQS
jgi:uncharacterized protein (UPF0335 family)